MLEALGVWDVAPNNDHCTESSYVESIKLRINAIVSLGIQFSIFLATFWILRFLQRR